MSVDRPRLHCHSAFKHYQMYHRNCGGSDYGNSVFNCTYNINGGNICGGGFWGGLFGGIGLGLGNMLGGLLGGFGFGGFGMGGFGFGGFSPFSNGFGFGMGGNSPFGNWGLGGTNGANGTIGTGNRSKAKEPNTKDKCKDKDQDIIKGFQGRRNDLLVTKDKDKALALYNEIVAKIKEPEDESHKDLNIEIYKGILRSLKTAYNFTLENENDPDGKAKSAEVKGVDNDDNGAGASGGSGVVDNGAGAGSGSGVVDNGEGTGDDDGVVDNVAGAGSGSGVVDNGEGTGDDDGVVDNGSGDGNGVGDGAAEAVTNTREYQKGHTNATDEDINNIKKGNKLDIIDTSEIEDFNGATITDFSNNVITVKSTSKIYIKYKLITTTKSGEKIFMSNKNHQHYVLQKRADGSLALMQYSWHKGYNVGDVTSDNRTLDNGFPEEEETLKEQD